MFWSLDAQRSLKSVFWLQLQCSATFILWSKTAELVQNLMVPSLSAHVGVCEEKACEKSSGGERKSKKTEKTICFFPFVPD